MFSSFYIFQQRESSLLNCTAYSRTKELYVKLHFVRLFHTAD